MEKYYLLSSVLWSARLRPPKPIAFDNHTHYPLTETNGVREGPGEKVLKATEETPKPQSAKTGKSHCVWSDFHFCVMCVCCEMKRRICVMSRLIEKMEINAGRVNKAALTSLKHGCAFSWISL